MCCSITLRVTAASRPEPLTSVRPGRTLVASCTTTSNDGPTWYASGGLSGGPAGTGASCPRSCWIFSAAADRSHTNERVVSGGACSGVLQSCAAVVHSTRGVLPDAPITLLCCARLRWAPYLVQRSTAQCSGATAGDGERPAHSQDGTGLVDRPIGSRATTIIHTRTTRWKGRILSK